MNQVPLRLKGSPVFVTPAEEHGAATLSGIADYRRLTTWGRVETVHVGANMKLAAIGIRTHSGWGALLAASGDAALVEVIDRRRIVMTDPNLPGAGQPFHFAAKLGLREAKEYLSNCFQVSERLALTAVQALIRELHNRNYLVTSSVVLLASGRTLPGLPEILSSHPLIHSAEGEFFRCSFWRACERLDLPVIGIRERDLDECADAVFGEAANQVWQRILSFKNSLGLPWTEDQKKASFAASVVLAARRRNIQLLEGRPSLELGVNGEESL